MDDLMACGFRGSAEWVHNWEGHKGHPYWPGGESGVTLDPGVDLGYVDAELWVAAYSGHLSHEQMESLAPAQGLRGVAARDHLLGHPQLLDIQITREQAREIFGWVAWPYWVAACRRWPGLVDAPAAVQTALLSLAYNRDPNNRHLSGVAGYLERADWPGLGRHIRGMQQRHRLRGIRRRRRAEGDLILEASCT